MKKLLFSLMLVLALLPSGCTVFFGNIGLVVEVTGTEGARFVGNVGGAGSLRSVEGTIPETIRLGQEKQAQVNLQKPGGGEMRVTIYNNGLFVKSEVTTATDGAVAMVVSI